MAFKTIGTMSDRPQRCSETSHIVCLSLSPVQLAPRRSIVCEAAPTKKPDSVAKRARRAEKRRIYHKAHKSEVRTRMKKVLEELDGMRKKPDAQPDDVFPIEKLIAQAYSVIDKAVKVGTLHWNTGARRKSRLARRKKAIEIHHGWYTPAPPLLIRHIRCSTPPNVRTSAVRWPVRRKTLVEIFFEPTLKINPGSATASLLRAHTNKFTLLRLATLGG